MGKIRYFLLTRSLGLFINLLSLFQPSRSKRLSYAVFSKPREGKLLPQNLPAILQSARRETLDAAGDVMQVYIWQGGPQTILLVHGWESNASRWERLLAYLSKNNATVVAIDAPNHGLSSGAFSLPHYADFIDRAVREYQPSVIIGHSLGAAASIFYGHKFAGSPLEKLIVLGAPSDFAKIVDNYGNLLRLGLRSRKLLGQHFKQLFNYHPEEFTAREFAKSLQLQGIIAHDRDDEVVLFEESGKIRQAWQHATFIETSGLGHSMHDDALYEKIAEFIFG